MNFPNAVKSGFRNYANFKGRATRSEFWWWTLFTVIVSAALSGYDPHQQLCFCRPLQLDAVECTTPVAVVGGS